MKDDNDDMIIDLFMSEHEECFDRFTFDKIFGFLLNNNFTREEAKEFMLIKCKFSALVLQERIYNKFYLKIDPLCISSDLLELKNEIFNQKMPKYFWN